MTIPTSVIGIFCEDVREEKSGGFTILGVMPDNATLPPGAPPGAIAMIPKLVIYVRVNFDPASPPQGVTSTLFLQDGSSQSLIILDDAILVQAAKESTTSGNPVAGVIGRVEMMPFAASKGRVKLEVTISGQTYIAGTLNFT
jgi:hypothetical protein